MWLFIFAEIYLATIAGIIYLISRLHKTELLNKIANTLGVKVGNAFKDGLQLK